MHGLQSDRQERRGAICRFKAFFGAKARQQVDPLLGHVGPQHIEPSGRAVVRLHVNPSGAAEIWLRLEPRFGQVCPAARRTLLRRADAIALSDPAPKGAGSAQSACGGGRLGSRAVEQQDAPDAAHLSSSVPPTAVVRRRYSRELGRHPNMREENHEHSIRQHWT
jgi:hypothetical protein